MVEDRPAKRLMFDASERIQLVRDSIGETVDVEVRPEAPGALQLLVRVAPVDGAPGKVIATQPIRVLAAAAP